MVTCPSGHETAAGEEFCDVCGLALDSAGADGAPVSAEPAPTGGSCRECGAAMDGRFCEECGADSLAVTPAAQAVPVEPTASPPREWTAVISADRAYFDLVQAAEGPDAASVTFPPYCPDRYFSLRGHQVTIGRHSASRGIVPDIDLTGPPEDPGVSRLHAMLVAQPDGCWAVVDVGSANGTTVNASPDPLPPNVPRPLANGDRVHVGAWTTITLRSHE